MLDLCFSDLGYKGRKRNCPYFFLSFPTSALADQTQPETRWYKDPQNVTYRDQYPTLTFLEQSRVREGQGMIERNQVQDQLKVQIIRGSIIKYQSDTCSNIMEHCSAGISQELLLSSYFIPILWGIYFKWEDLFVNKGFPCSWASTI